jgi:hypothetical protein
MCGSREELRGRKAEFEKLPLVAKTEEIASLVPDSPPEQTAKIAAICRQLAALPEKLPAAAALDPARLLPEIARAQELLARDTPFETHATALLGQLRGVISREPAAEIAARLRARARSAGDPAAGGSAELADPRAAAEDLRAN